MPPGDMTCTALGRPDTLGAAAADAGGECVPEPPEAPVPWRLYCAASGAADIICACIDASAALRTCSCL
eukprot:356861-Chlamydomonas_euryale.AAC.3